MAASFRVLVCAPTDEGDEMGVFEDRDPEAGPRFDWSSREALALEALAALASSQEVRAWLLPLAADVARQCESHDGEDRVHYLDAATVVADAILNALGGGE